MQTCLALVAEIPPTHTRAGPGKWATQAMFSSCNLSGGAGKRVEHSHVTIAELTAQGCEVDHELRNTL